MTAGSRGVMLVTRILVFFLFLAAAVGETVTMEDVDCGHSKITEGECVAKGCVWIENFPGPWCQTADSPYIPSWFDFGLDNMNEDQQIIFNYATLCFITLSMSIVLSSQRKIALNLDLVIVGIFLVLACITRYHNIKHPKEVVFDEFYFGHFANSYCKRIYVFDIHPPLAKLTHYFMGSLLGAKCSMNFHAEGDFVKYSHFAQYVPYRIVSAFFGTIVVPLAYLVGREFKLSVPSSIVLGAFVLCDSLLLSETRLILTDSQLFFYIVLAIYCALKLWHSERTGARNFWTVATAVASGCAFCVKFTALATLGWIAFVTLLAAYGKKRIGILRCLVASCIAAIVFAVPFYFHILLGKRSGNSDWNLDVQHQELLNGNFHYNPDAVAPSFASHLIYLIKRMLEQNVASVGEHGYASYWYDWIVGKGALLAYAEHREDEDWHGHIFIVGNVFICYTILASIIVFFPLAAQIIQRNSFRLSVRELHFVKTGSLLLLGWIANLLPYALVERTTYSYHYLPGQFYGMIMVCLIFDEFSHYFFSLFYKEETLKKVVAKLRSVVAILFLVVLLWNYFYYSCLVYGYGISNFETIQRLSYVT